MTEVLSLAGSNGHSSYFDPPPRRSSSYTLFPDSTSYNPDLNNPYRDRLVDAHRPASEPSSAHTSPYIAALDISRRPSCMSTPTSSLSLNDPKDEEICFPAYEEDLRSLPKARLEDDSDDNGNTTPPSSPDPTASFELQTAINSASGTVAFARLFDPETNGGDDLAINIEPTRHVDYLSHVWKEEDIWSSWRYIVARRQAFSNSARLENAAWRTWAKFKHCLQTINPDTLNWMKDHDVTWLYGPLLTGRVKLTRSDVTPPTSQMSRSNSFASKKPILKKRSLSERMLQRSLSSSTLMKQATDALRAQQPGALTQRPCLGSRNPSDLGTSSGSETPLTRPSRPSSSELSTSSSGLQTPSIRRHIHFNNKVEQCIAINKDAGYFDVIDDDDESEDDLLTMQMHPVKSSKLSRPSTPRNSFSSEAKTIAMLPSTTLNYRSDTPPTERSRQTPNLLLNQNPNFFNMNVKPISPSPSLQTLRPSTPSTNFLIDDDDDDDEMEGDLNWQPLAGRRDNSAFPRGGVQLEMSDDDDGGSSTHDGRLRRTPSGMFMPYDPDEDDGYPRDGIIGRMVDTVNTARDIAHVIWNVGWRR